MRATVRDRAFAIVLFALGVAVAATGAAGVMHGIAPAVPARRLSSTAGSPQAMWWLRRCLATPRCREPAAALLAASVAAHGPALWGGALLVAVSSAWLGLLRLRPLSPPRPIGGARFASRAELRRLARTPEAWFPLGYARPWRLPLPVRRAAGPGSMRAAARAQPVRLPPEDLARHVLVVGLTGAHKTTALTFPVLIEAARAGVSVVALDLKYGEEDSLARAAPEWQHRGRDVLVFAPLDPLSLRWNPLALCATPGDAHRLAVHLFDDAGAGDPDLLYWMGAERHICAALGLALATDGGPPALERLRALCEAGPAAVEAYVQAHPAGRSLAARLGAYRAMLPKDQAGILQGVASRLEAWADEAVCRATGPGPSWNEVDLGRLRREPVLLVVGVPQPALGRLRWLCHLFLRELAACLVRPRGPDERIRVLQVLEELPAWGRLPGLADHLATFRSRQVSVLATIQSEAQGEHVYGREGWAAVVANLVTKIYFPSLADLDAERLSRALGTATGQDVARSRGWGAGGRRGGEHRREVPVPLKRPEELQGAGAAEDEILVRCPGLPPMRLWCPPFHARPQYRERVSHRPASTAELAVYHHLWFRRARGAAAQAAPACDRCSAGAPPADAGVPLREEPASAPPAAPAGAYGPAPGGVRPGTPAQAAGSAGLAPAPRGLRPAARVGPSGGTPGPCASPAPDDLTALARFVERLLDEPRGGGAAPVRCLCRGSRVTEVHVDPSVALPLCGGPDVAHATLRRWAALRWVRRVRPAFVLERRAIDALSEALRRRLAEACGDGD